MSQPQIEIQLIAMVVAVACALPGVFLILRRMVMMSDAISHAILLGIVLGFFLTHDLSSPFLVAAAAITGVLTVVLSELLNKTRLVKEDAAIGLVFPALFSIGVILIAQFAGDVHLDTDSVLLGELAFAPFSRFEIAGTDLGPRALWVMGGILVINLVFILLFFKELKLASFDPGLAAALGFSPTVITYVLMSLVSITAVGAFDADGSILVVALMVAAPAAAYLLTDRLSVMLMLSSVFGIVYAISGYWMAHWLDASIAGSMAVMAGIVFGIVFLLAPQRGIVAIARRRARQRWEFPQTMLAIHLAHHEGRPEEADESRINTLYTHMRWNENFTRKITHMAERKNLVRREGEHLKLTEKGRVKAAETVTL